MKTLEELKTDRSTFSIGEAISDGWGLVSKYLGYYILGAVLTFAIGIGVGIIPVVGGIANNLVLSPCLMAGAIYVTWRISKGIGWTDFGDMFKGFNFIGPVVISTLIQTSITVILMILFFLNYLDQIIELFRLGQGSDIFSNQEEIRDLFLQMVNPESVILFVVLMCALLLISVIWAFKTHFIIIYKMQAWPAMDMSRRLATHNLLPLIGLFIVLGFIVLISAIPCGIGLLFSLPLAIGATYSAFAQITHCDRADEMNEDMFDFKADNKQP
jgi:hypothetical protein